VRVTHGKQVAVLKPDGRRDGVLKVPDTIFDKQARGSRNDIGSRVAMTAAPDQVLGSALALQRKRATILVVDEEGSARRALADALSREGFRVIAATSGEEAIDVLWRDKERIDWLFTSLVLPGAVDGIRVAEEFRFAHPLRAVVFTSDSPGDRRGSGPSSLLVPKPYRPTEIAATFRVLSRGNAERGRTASAAFPEAAVSSAEPKRGRCG